MALLDLQSEKPASAAAWTVHPSWWRQAFPWHHLRARLRLHRRRRRRALLARAIDLDRFGGQSSLHGQTEYERFFTRLLQARMGL